MNARSKSFAPWLSALALVAHGLSAREPMAGEELFTGPVPGLQIEIPAAGMRVLRDYQQVWRQPRPERIDVKATVREGGRVYTNVAVHLKGSYSFQPIDGKPSLTLNFDRFAPGQRFHGLTKIHLNNSVQDPSYLCEALARDLFQSVGVPSPRATPALVTINGTGQGVSVLIEGANKLFVKSRFDSAQGNLYDGGSGGDVTKALETDSGENPDDRSDLTNLVRSARARVSERLAKLERVLDVNEFITFAATEACLVHWDGYALGCNNYRVFHDVARGKMVFIPHGLDQLFGVSSSPSLSLTPVFKGMVAKQLFEVPEARQRYLARIGQLSTNELRTATLHARVDRMAARLRPALPRVPGLREEWESAVEALKSRIEMRAASVADQLQNPKRQSPVTDNGSIQLGGWSFKGGTTQPAAASRVTQNNRPILRVTGRGGQSSGAWRTTVLLGPGLYEFSGLARTEAFPADAPGTNGVILRMSGERSTKGIAAPRDWTRLVYEFEVGGISDVELVCEYRGPEGTGMFDLGSLRLIRKSDGLMEREGRLGQ